MIAAAALLFSVTSCDNEKGAAVPESTGNGTVKISLDFDKPLGSRALSTAKPLTSFQKNIKDLTFVLTKKGDDNLITYVRSIDVPTSGIESGAISFTGINKGEYKVYVVANVKATNNVHVDPSYTSAKAQAIEIGHKFNENLYSLMEVTPSVTAPKIKEDPNSKTYGEPAEVFVAKSPGLVTVEADKVNTDLSTAPMLLTRAVSLLRIRINQTSEYAKTIDFSKGSDGKPGAGIRLRRANKDLNYSTGAVSGSSVGNNITSLYSNKAFKSLDPSDTDYNKGTKGMDLSPTGFSLWNDYVMLPGGGKTSDKAFNLVVMGYAPKGYRGSNGELAPDGGAMVMWQAIVRQEDANVIKANEILELNVTFTGPGTFVTESEPIPPVGDYGGLDIKVKLAEWGSIKGVDVPM